MGVNVDHIRVTKLDDRIQEDESPTVCFTYGANMQQKGELKQAQSEAHTPKDDWFSEAKSKMICPQIKLDQET